jgi:hypothetical protein
MYIVLREEIATQRIADLQRSAAKHRLLDQLHAGRPSDDRRRRIRDRLILHRARPAVIAGEPGQCLHLP